jgi:hypothetical protein
MALVRHDCWGAVPTLGDVGRASIASDPVKKESLAPGFAAVKR